MPLLITLFIAQAQHLEQARSFSLELFNKYGVKSLLLTPQQTNIPSEFVVANSLKSLEDTLTKLGYTIIFTDEQVDPGDKLNVCGTFDFENLSVTLFAKSYNLSTDLDAFMIALIKSSSGEHCVRSFNNKKYVFASSQDPPEEYNVSPVQPTPYLLNQPVKVWVEWNFGDSVSAHANFAHLTNDKITLVTANKPGSSSVVINSSEHLNATSIYFCMEPAEYALACTPLFLGTHGRHLNNCEWHLSSTLAELKTKQVVKIFDKVLSVVVSAKAVDPGHVFRLALIKQMDQMPDLPFVLDIYGRCESLGFKNYRGELPPLAKDSALFPYKYHLNVENHYLTNYITEKLYDGLCAECLTFYKGAPNYTDYFDAESVVELSGNVARDIDLITKTILSGEYEARRDSIVKNKQKILNQYGFEPRVWSIVQIVQTHCFVTTLEVKQHLLEDGFKSVTMVDGFSAQTLKDCCVRSIDQQIPVFFCHCKKDVLRSPFDRLCFAFAADNTQVHGYCFGKSVCLLPGGAEQVLKTLTLEGLKLYKA